jgi:parallel beta-helix repeat protein
MPKGSDILQSAAGETSVPKETAIPQQRTLRLSRLPLALVSFAAVMASFSLPAHAQTPINSCGTTITASGSYLLAADLNCNPGAAIGASTGIAISASNVDLDLGGHTLGGRGPAFADVGVVVGETLNICASPSGTRNVRVHDGSIANFPDAVLLCQASEAIVDHLSITGVQKGVSLSSGTNDTVVQLNPNIDAQVYAIGILAGSSNDTVFQNIVTANTEAILIQDGSTGNLISNNTISTIGGSGIVVGSSSDGSEVDSGNNIQGNSVSVPPENPLASLFAGILLYTGATNAIVSNNQIGGPGTYGIVLTPCASTIGAPPCKTGPTGLTIESNTVNFNTRGISIFGSAGNHVDGNIAKKNTIKHPGLKARDVSDDNDGSKSKPCANFWHDNDYRTKGDRAKCIEHSSKVSLN